MTRPVTYMLALCALVAAVLGPLPARALNVVSPVVTLVNADCGDQDDMCFWLHPQDLSRSTVIVSDKKANSLFVYDLQGRTLQTIGTPKPGNIDIRYDFPLGGERADIVALNDRKTRKIRIYKVDRATRLLSRVDDDNILTGENYGFTLYRSPMNGRLYAFTGPEQETVIKQWELVDAGSGRVSGVGPLRSLSPGGVVEGMVADDETGTIYVSQESGGVWKYSAEPTGDASGTRIVAAGEHGLVPDVEGITLYYRAGGAGYIIISSQGSNDFKVYDRKPPHAYIGTFAVKGTESTDGCDVINLPLGRAFPGGVFACHNGAAEPRPVELVHWSDIARSLGLGVDGSYWDPRKVRAHDVGRQRTPVGNVSQGTPDSVRRVPPRSPAVRER